MAAKKINQKTDKDFTANVAPDTSLDKTTRALKSYFMVKRAIWSFLTSLGVRLTEPTIWLCEGEIRTVFIKRFSCRLLPGKEKRTSPFFSNWFGKCGNSYPHQGRCIELDMYHVRANHLPFGGKMHITLTRKSLSTYQLFLCEHVTTGTTSICRVWIRYLL